MQFKNKKELIDFINKQVNVLLENDNNNILNKKRNILHTTIILNNKNTILSILKKYNINYEHHTNNDYFIYVK